MRCASDVSSAIELRVTGQHTEVVHVFRTWPVRIGRAPATVDCKLEASTVSRRHARIELLGDELVLFDEGSRHGILVREGTERVVGRVFLSSVGSEFQIGPFRLKATLIDLPDVDAPDNGPPPGALNVLTTTYAQAAVDPTGVDVDAALQPLRELCARHHAEAREALFAALAGTDAAARGRLLRAALEQLPELARIPAIADLMASCGVLPAAASATATVSHVRKVLLGAVSPL